MLCGRQKCQIGQRPIAHFSAIFKQWNFHHSGAYIVGKFVCTSAPSQSNTYDIIWSRGPTVRATAKALACVRVSSVYMVCPCVCTRVHIGLHPYMCNKWCLGWRTNRPYTAVSVSGQGHSSRGPVSSPSVCLLSGAADVVLCLWYSLCMQAGHCKSSRTLGVWLSVQKAAYSSSAHRSWTYPEDRKNTWKITFLRDLQIWQHFIARISV